MLLGINLGEVDHQVMMTLEEDINEDEVEYVVHLLPNYKPWIGLELQLQIRFLRLLLSKWKTLMLYYLKKCVTFDEMPGLWKVSLIKLTPKVFVVSFAQWRPISLMGGMYKIFYQKFVFLVCCGNKNEYCKWVACVRF